MEKYDDPVFPEVRFCGDDAAGVVEISKTVGGVADRQIKAFVGDSKTPIASTTL